MVPGMSKPVHPSRGMQLLAEWKGGLLGQQACKLLDLDHPSFSRFVHGIRKPPGEVAARIEKLTNGTVPAASWYEPPRSERRRRAS